MDIRFSATGFIVLLMELLGNFLKIFSVFSQDVLADKTNGYYSLPRLPPVTCNAYFQVLFQIKISCDL